MNWFDMMNETPSTMAVGGGDVVSERPRVFLKSGESRLNTAVFSSNKEHGWLTLKKFGTESERNNLNKISLTFP